MKVRIESIEELQPGDRLGNLVLKSAYSNGWRTTEGIITKERMTDILTRHGNEVERSVDDHVPAPAGLSAVVDIAKEAQDLSGEGRREHFYPPYEFIPHVFLDRIATVMGVGAEKYGPLNYLRFTPEQQRDIARHIVHHGLSFLHGDTSEDHLAHAACNCLMLMHCQENNNGS